MIRTAAQQVPALTLLGATACFIVWSFLQADAAKATAAAGVARAVEELSEKVDDLTDKIEDVRRQGE